MNTKSGRVLKAAIEREWQKQVEALMAELSPEGRADFESAMRLATGVSRPVLRKGRP